MLSDGSDAGEPSESVTEDRHEVAIFSPYLGISSRDR
jgi:hypothetical protein